MASRAVFACPLYDMKNHFQLALELCKSKMEFNIQADFYFIFSDDEQKGKFFSSLKTVGIEKEFFYLILPEKYQKYTSKAVTKKIYALKELKDKYEYIILVDCESVFIKECNYDDLAEKIWESRSMLNSNISPDGFFIMRKCYKTMGIYYNKTLKKELENYKYNFWFNELQVYKCSYLTGFFDWLNEHNMDAVLNTKECFEYYVFYAYMLIVNGMHINKFNYVSMGGINEYLAAFPEAKQREIIETMGLHWASTKEAVTPNVVMLFHLDRSKEDDEYGFQKMKEANKILLKRKITIIKDYFIRK